MSVKPPTDLCPAHTAIWRKWRAVRYSSLHPTEWPGGTHIMDSRTTHAERRADWERKTAEQLALTEQLCRSGNSPQCNRPAATGATPAERAEAAGRAGYADGRRAPMLDPTVRELTAGMEVGEGAADIFRAYLRGYDAAADEAAREVLAS